MKKGIFMCMVIIVFCMTITLAELNSRELIVNGNSYNVEIPSDMTAEDAFYEAFQLYLEAEDDCKKAVGSLESVTEELIELRKSVISYKTEAERYIVALEESKVIQEELKGKYRKLSEEYEELSSLYRKMLRPTFLSPYLGLGLDRDMDSQSFTPSLQVGAVVFEKIGLNTNIRYNIKDNGWSLGLQLGMRF